MIFVTVGTNEARFDRLIEAVAALDVDEKIVVQRGSSAVYPENAEVTTFYPSRCLWSSFARHVRWSAMRGSARSWLLSPMKGSRSSSPRLKAFGEAVDDHQMLFARPSRPKGW